MQKASNMVADNQNSTVKKNKISFKPPHLDKLVFLMQLTGIAHTSSPVRGAKKISLFIYIIFIICIRLFYCTVKTITEVLTIPSKDLNYHLLGSMNLVMIGFQMYMMLYILFLSRKSLLASLPKPSHWISLPEIYEKEASVVNSILFYFCNLLLFILFIPGSLYLIFTQKDGIQSCNVTSTNATTPANDTNHLCYTVYISYLITLPSSFCLMTIPTYVALWIMYCQRLFEGVNKSLEKMDSPLNLKSIIRCRNQYNMICDLVENVNEKYGVFIAYFLFVASFNLFVSGYSTLISIVNGEDIVSSNFVTLPLTLIGSTALFGYSFSFEKEVGFSKITYTAELSSQYFYLLVLE